MKLFIVVSILGAVLLASAGCGSGERNSEQAEDRQQDSAPDSLILASPGLTACTLSVADDLPPIELKLYWVGPPEVPEGFRGCHTVTATPLGSEDTAVFDGLDARYYGDAPVQQYLIFEDMNFDGYTDVRLMQSPTAGPNTYWYFLLFDPATGNLIPADGYSTDDLVSPEFDQDSRLIKCFHSDGMGMYGREVYTVEDNRPVLVRSEETEYDGEGSNTTITREYLHGQMVRADTLVEPAQ